jgi:hypothetical protein
MSNSKLVDFSLGNTTRILNGALSLVENPNHKGAVTDRDSLLYEFVDRIQPDVMSKLTGVLMHRALHRGRDPSLDRDIAANHQGKIFDSLEITNSFFKDKLGQSIVSAYEKKQVNLFHKLLRYASLNGVQIPEVHLDTLHDLALKNDDMNTYHTIFYFKQEMDKRIYEQRDTDPLSFEQLVKDSTTRFNQDLISLIKTKKTDAFLSLVGLLETKASEIYDINQDQIGFQQVKNYFFARHGNIDKSISDKNFNALGDNFDELTTKEKTQLINNSIIELLKTDPVIGILSLGKTVNLDKHDYNPDLDPHALRLMKAKLESLTDNSDLDRNLVLGMQSQFKEIAEYHLGKASHIKTHKRFTI